jgi:hypothetical protein
VQPDWCSLRPPASPHHREIPSFAASCWTTLLTHSSHTFKYVHYITTGTSRAAGRSVCVSQIGPISQHHQPATHLPATIIAHSLASIPMLVLRRTSSSTRFSSSSSSSSRVLQQRRPYGQQPQQPVALAAVLSSSTPGVRRLHDCRSSTLDTFPRLPLSSSSSSSRFSTKAAWVR